MRAFPLAVSLWLATSASGGEAPGFAMPPKAAREGEGVKVAFAVSAPTDVEVAILDAQGNVVRHLAAGVLGGDVPPPEPLRPGLAQSLLWDGKDDLGQPAAGGPFKARVRAGMGVEFGRIIGGSPYTGVVDSMPFRAPVNGLAVDEKGNLYVKMHSAVGSHGNSGMWPWHIRKFDRTGKYIETILPYPPSTDPSKASGFKLLETGDGSFTPANLYSLYPVFYVFGNEVYNQVVDGSLLFIHTEERRLNFFKLDGSNAVRTVVMWPPGAKLKCPVWLDIQVALSPDRRFAYHSNAAGTAYDGKKPSDIDPEWPQGRIYRQDLSAAPIAGDGHPPPERFFDLQLPDWGTGSYAGPIVRYTRELEPAPLPTTGKHTYGSLYGRAGRGCSVCGLDVDARGTVYATWGSNDCHVRAYDPNGQLVPSERTAKLGEGEEKGEAPALITGVSGYGGSIRVDPAGSIYLAQQGVPKDHKPPKGFEKDEAYRNAIGSILKFGPKGGERSKGDDAMLGFSGVQAIYPGCGPISRWRCVGACACTKPRFDVDAYGRPYIPNAITFCVSVRDNAGNEIVRFGHYGNFDAQGPGSKEPKPEVPLGWPVAAGASEKSIYVGDCLNHRVVRVDKAFAAEAVCSID